MSNNIANLLIEYELLVSRLYVTCAEKYPGLGDFWKKLAKEEVGHANSIRETLAKVDGRSVVLNQRRFNERPLEISMEHINEIITRVDSGDIDLIGALSLALDLEQSTLESKYYEIFIGRSRGFNEKMRQVRNESRLHAARVREMKEKVLDAQKPKEYEKWD